MKTPDLYLKALGIYLPDDRVTLAEAIKSEQAGPDFQDSDLIEVPVAAGMAPADMAVTAARKVLETADSEIDLFVYAPMFRQAPEGFSLAGYILRELGSDNIAAYELVQGANGFFAALELAAGWLSLSSERATALVTTALNAESSSVDRWRSGGPGIALGDAASAVLLGREPGGVARVDAVNSLTFPELEGAHRGAAQPLEQGTRIRKVDPSARSKEFAFTVGLQPLSIHERFVKIHTEIANRSLSDAGIELEDLAKVIFINVGATLTEMGIMRPLGLPMEKATAQFGCTLGHLGASDHIVTLDHLISSGELTAGDRVLLMSGAPGYNAASAVLTITA
jgi:3-oxoacyl-[acyl-carrier-protein] synthase-3